MIGGVLELGERTRPRGHGGPRRHRGAARWTRDAGRDGGDHRGGGPLAHPGLRRQHRQHRGHPLRQGPAALPRGRRPAAADPAASLRDAALRARVDARRRPAPQPAAAPRPHRHRARRVRRHGRPGHHRGPHRGDRGRDPGRVRRGGADDRAARATTRRGSTAAPTWTTCSSTSTARLDGEDQEEFDTVGGLVYHHIGGVPQVGDAVEVDGLRLTVEATDGRRVRTVPSSASRRRRAEAEDRATA